jgi:recombination protein RecA
MGVKKITGIAEIDSIAAALSKKFGGKSIISMGPQITEVDTFSSGSLSLDCILGVGGVPDDRILEIFGPSSAGKTSLALQIARNYVTERGYDRPPVFIDLERTTGLDLIVSMGLEPDKMLFAYPDTAEEALQIAIDLGLSGKVGMIIFDSIDAAQTEKETKRQMTEMGVGDLPRIMSKSMRTLSKVCVDKKVLYIFINQIRMKIGVMYGNPETTSGGNALPYYASVRMRVSSKPNPAIPDALAMKVAIKKNKLAPALNKKAEFIFICGKGIDPHQDTIEFAKTIGIIRFAGSAVKISLPDKEEYTLCTGGKLGAADHLLQNPEDYKTIRNACLTASGIRVPEEEEAPSAEEAS